MKPYLIPRLNYDFSLYDFIVGLRGLLSKDFRIPELEKIFESNNIYFLNHARSCLQLFLESLELPPGSKIGVQVFNCDTVFRSITNAGYQPLFIDINDKCNIDIKDIELKLSEIKVLIVTHTFGFPADIKKIKSICKDIPIIEDCAHSFLSKVDGKLTGTFGDAAIFSFGNAKFPAIGEGGWLLINRNKYLNNFSKKYQMIPFQSLTSQILSSIKNLFLNTLHNKYVYKYFTRPFINNFAGNRDFTGKTDIKIFKPNQIYFLTLSRKIKLLNHYLSLQINNAKTIINSLKSHNLHSVEVDINIEPNYFMMPLIMEDVGLLIKRFRKNGLEIKPHFISFIFWASHFGYRTGSCPNAERVAHKYVTIPTYSSEIGNIFVVDS